MHILIHIPLRIPIRTPNPESVSSTPTVTNTLVRTHHWCYLAVATESAHPSTTQASSLHAIPPPWILHPTAVTTPMPPRPKAYIRLRPVPLVPFRFFPTLHDSVSSHSTRIIRPTTQEGVCSSTVPSIRLPSAHRTIASPHMPPLTYVTPCPSASPRLSLSAYQCPIPLVHVASDPPT